jgi:hypothetical protein
MIEYLFYIFIGLILLVQFYGQSRMDCDRLRQVVVVLFVCAVLGASVALVKPVVS